MDKDEDLGYLVNGKPYQIIKRCPGEPLDLSDRKLKPLAGSPNRELETDRLRILAEELGYTPEDRDPSQDRITKSGRKLHHIGDGYTVETGLTHHEFGDINDLAIEDHKSMDAVIAVAVRLYIKIRKMGLDREVKELMDKTK